MSTLTPEAKNKLSNTIRTLRERLLTDLHNAADSAYRLSVPLAKSGLDEEQRLKRQRLEAWLDEQARSESRSKQETVAQARERHRLTAEKLAAATFLNRIVVIKHMEALELLKPKVVTEGWQSPGYREFRDFAPALLKDDTEGFNTLLQLLYDELAQELPGLFGDVGVTGLFPIPAATLRAVIEALDNPELESAWTDDTTLGWVYQFWNDPERKALDDKVNNGGKIERHEIAAKTELFTERYMVEWLLQNSLGQQWLAICEKNGWVPDASSSGALDALEARRKEWCAKRETGEVTPETMMPIESEEEHRWKYWVPQVLSRAMVDAVPDTIRKLKILDPAVGSGHFLIIAFDLLAAFYQEEARHRGEDWTPKQIAESIIENNLHGVDLDPRAVQIAAAAILLKAKTFCPNAEPRVINLVASNLGLTSLPDDDPAVLELKREIQQATGIPETLTDTILHALKGADYLGSLLKVDEAVDAAIREYERTAGLVRSEFSQGDMFTGFRPEQTVLSFNEARISVLEQLDRFLTKCTNGDDLGLRLWGEQLAAGVRFVRLLKEGQYDLVVANPPYLGTNKMADAKYIDTNYPNAKADLLAAFIERSEQLLRQGSYLAMITMHNWMFLSQFTDFRVDRVVNSGITVCAHMGRGGGFSGWADFDKVMQTTLFVCIKGASPKDTTIWFRLDEFTNQGKHASLLVNSSRFERAVATLSVITGQPLIYWWDEAFLTRYAETPKLGEKSPVRQGLATGINNRYVRIHWEVHQKKIFISKITSHNSFDSAFKWSPYIKGASDKRWFEPLADIVDWQLLGCCYAYSTTARFGRGAEYYFKPGVSYSTIGSTFSARARRFKSIFDVSGASVFPKSIPHVVCLMNSALGRGVLAALNPTVNFQVGDVNRLSLFPIDSADEIFAKLDETFTEHEATRETSVEFKQPGLSAWNYTQGWAQKAVDREPGTPLPDYQPVYDNSPAANHVSYAIGVALGRFGANGEGILNEVLNTTLPAGILYLSTYSDNDSLHHSTCQPIKDAWAKYGDTIASDTSLRIWLQQAFFKDVHLGMYENRPIYFPLSSHRKNFVALVSIHRWADNTLQTLLADYLIPELNQLEGGLHDLMAVRTQGDRKAQTEAENRYNDAKALYDELKVFIDLVRQCAESGPPPARPQDTPHEVDARFVMDLDDGVMINSAALWPLLEPQWKQPRTWWSELCNAKGKNDYDWSHLAARYFPKRVDAKCQYDPSLAVAHGYFWKYHPAKAYEWELRLQDEIGPDFTIDEAHADELRVQFTAVHPDKVKALIAAEYKRREKNRKKTSQASGRRRHNEGELAGEMLG
jgi:hypothetical protein